MARAHFKIYVYRPPQINPDTTLTYIGSGNGFIPIHVTASVHRINHNITTDELSL